MAVGMSAAGANKLMELQLLARSARGASAVAIVRQATEHPALFAFGEILAAPGVTEVCARLPRKRDKTGRSAIRDAGKRDKGRGGAR